MLFRSDSNTIIVGDFNTSLTPMDRSSKMKINKETEALNDTIDQIDLVDIYRTFHPKDTGKNKTHISAVYKRPLQISPRDTYRLKVRE